MEGTGSGDGCVRRGHWGFECVCVCVDVSILDVLKPHQAYLVPQGLLQPLSIRYRHNWCRFASLLFPLIIFFPGLPPPYACMHAHTLTSSPSLITVGNSLLQCCTVRLLALCISPLLCFYFLSNPSLEWFIWRVKLGKHNRADTLIYTPWPLPHLSSSLSASLFSFPACSLSSLCVSLSSLCLHLQLQCQHFSSHHVRVAALYE